MEMIFYILDRVFKMTHIPVRCLDKTGEIVLFCRGCVSTDDPLIGDPILRHSILKKLFADDLPILEFEEEIVYGACKYPVEYSIILGPVCLNTIDQAQISRYARQHKIAAENFKMKHRTLEELCAALATISFSLTGKFVTEMDIFANNGSSEEKGSRDPALQATLLENAEQEMPRFNFSDEKAYMQYIREGNPQALKDQVDVSLASLEGRVGKMALKNFKQYEYLAAAAITVATRAAIDGGLDSLTAYAMSDMYLQRLEKCKETIEIYKMLPEVMLGYAERVQLQKYERSQLFYIEQCKIYIANHLTKHFSVDDIAGEIGINKSYLSRRFSEAEGMGIQQYSQIKRVEAAADMLKFSDESILAIAHHLCFASQSHFGKVFKDNLGLTPQKYREKNKLVDFRA